MGKKLIYICSDSERPGKRSEKDAKGVNLKIEEQIKQFKAVGYDTLMCAPKENYMVDLGNILNPFGTVMNWSHVKPARDVSAVYTRLPMIDLAFLKILMEIKKRNKDVKILFEIPTYPYKGEMKTVRKRLLYYRGCFWGIFLKFFVDRIVLSTPGYKKVFGIRVMYVPNGVAYDNRKLPEKVVNEGEIHLAAVSSMRFWHGYERLFEGLSLYYKTKREITVVVHLVGTGIELKKYQLLVKKYHLEKYVIFEGFCTGEKLDGIYDKCHIGVGSLGIHRIDSKLNVSSLKLKEYASKGLPFVTEGFCDMEYPKTKKYILKVPSDETAINITDIVSFYNRIYSGSQMVNVEIKEKFRKYYDMEKVFKPVTDFLTS